MHHSQDVIHLAPPAGDPWWWFSFFDMARPSGERLLGVALVQGRDQWMATAALARFGCHSGGEARCIKIPAELCEPPEPYQERLLSPEEARTLADLMEARRPVPPNARSGSLIEG